MKEIKITDNMQEKLKIGKELFESKPEIYDDYMANYIRGIIDKRFQTGGDRRSNERRLILSFNL